MNKKMLESKQILVLGQRGGGKTTWVKSIVKEMFPRHIVFDVNYSVNPHDWQGFNRYIVESSTADDLKEEFDSFFSELEQTEISGKTHFLLNGKVLDALVIEEANMLAPSMQTPPKAFKFITNIGRHVNLTVFMLARRPVQMHTDAVELADYLVIFALSGKNDIAYLNDVKNKLGDAVTQLDVDNHDFIIWKRGAKEFSHFRRIAL